MSEIPVTSPELPVRDKDLVFTPKQYSDGLTLDLSDAEIKQSFEYIVNISNKWRGVFATKLRHANFSIEDAMKLVDQFEDELKTTLMEKMDLLVSVDVTNVFYGGSPIVVLEGALPGHSSAKYGQDHERKGYEVKLAQERGEDFLGAKEALPGRAKRRDQKAK